MQAQTRQQMGGVYYAYPEGPSAKTGTFGTATYVLSDSLNVPQGYAPFYISHYGRQFSMSRQAFINDDIGFLSEVPGLYAAKSKKQINKAVYSILYGNGTIYDGKTFFHNDHKNLMSTASAPSAAAIQSMIQRLQIQEDQFGEAINLTPRTLVVPVGYGFTLQTIFGSPTIQTTENTQAVNPLYNYRYPIEIVEDATLNVLAGTNACPWFLGAGKDETAGIQVDYLNGQETPTFRRSVPRNHGSGYQ